ncbi:uncharacterized protein LOC118190212 [Stegodyphus dumicola]|uniref:uncharacterized protein LOC118190212 n=1 Tax=Stegodyphus dumicola TaxID=202533 RepID=UPI0015AA9F5E|nr:uncharacterized protein LOC118190212 [Stegodyphus dumicola]
MMSVTITNSKIGIIPLLVIGLFFHYAQGRLRHCYVCRSRGELGDCKDPFMLNATSVEDVRGVEAVPCASGWCAKIIEGQNDDFDTATERMCVQRPPADGEERCSNTIIDKEPVFMCFCYGDLCNAARRPIVPLITIIFMLLLNHMRGI